MRLRLVPKETNWDFFGRAKLWLGISGLLMVIAFVSFLVQGLNYGIDFSGGTTIRAESTTAVDVGVLRAALTQQEGTTPQYTCTHTHSTHLQVRVLRAALSKRASERPSAGG